MVSSSTGLAARVLTMACVLAAASAAPGRGCSAGEASGSRIISGKGTLSRWHLLSLPTEGALRSLVALPPHGVAGLDGEGTFWVFDVGRAALSVSGRYGSVASVAASLAAVRLDQDRTGIALVAPEGRLLVWSDGALRAYDVGSPLSRRTPVVPIAMPGRLSHDLLAVAEDGAVVLIGGLAAGGPRVVARLDVHALVDGRIGLVDLDGDGIAEAVILTDPMNRGGRPDDPGAASATVIALRPNGLALRGRFTLTAPAAFEVLVPVGAPIRANPRLAAALLVKSMPEQGDSVVALGLRDNRLAILAEGQALGQGQRSVDVIGPAHLSGDAVPEIIAVETGVVTAYRRVGTSLQRAAQTAGYASRAPGTRSVPEALIGDLDGDGKPEVVVARRSRDALVGLGLEGARFAVRWSLDLGTFPQSNLVAADLDGDGLLDLAVADGRALHLFLNIR